MRAIETMAAALLALGLAPGAQAQYSIAAPHPGTSLSVWMQELSGELGGVDAGFRGQATLVEDGATSAGLTGNSGRWEFGLASMDHATTAPVEASFRFDGQVFTAGDTLQVDHRVRMVDLFRRLPLSTGEQAGFHALAGLKVLDLKSDLQGLAGLVQASLDEVVPVPMVGFGARLGDDLGAHGFAGLRWVSAGIGDVDVAVLDWSVGAAFQPSGDTRLALGYRDFNIDVEITDQADSGRIDLSHGGAFFEAGVQF